MMQWRLEEGTGGLRLQRVARRGFGSETLTWAQLLYGRLALVRVYVIYFPSRFDLPLDTTVKEALRIFGRNTGPGTSVNFWDAADPEFSRALQLFDLKAPPALVFVTGLALPGVEPSGPDKANLYTISISDPEILHDRERLAAAANTIHEVLARGDPGEITGYIRQRAVASVLDAIGRIAAAARDQILKLKPSFGLPGGISIQVGG